MMKKVIVALSMLVMCLVVQAQERTDKWGVPYVKLNNGVEMPRFGLGTYAVSNDDCKQACLVALKDGYRHIDTAHAYNNEKGVGAAIKESGVPREEIWVTSKLWPTEYGVKKHWKPSMPCWNVWAWSLSICSTSINLSAIT